MPKVDKTPELLEASNANLFAPPSVPAVTANVALKLPVFWLEVAEVWFAQADAQFAIKTNVADQLYFDADPDPWVHIKKYGSGCGSGSGSGSDLVKAT